MGINIDNYFSSGNSLKASDIAQGTQVRAVIERCEEVMFKGDDGKDQPKLRLAFQGQEKGLILNKTNAMSIAHQYGSDTDQWIGKEILLYSTKVDFGGSMVDAIRINTPMQTTDIGSFNNYPEAQQGR